MSDRERAILNEKSFINFALLFYARFLCIDFNSFNRVQCN